MSIFRSRSFLSHLDDELNGLQRLFLLPSLQDLLQNGLATGKHCNQLSICSIDIKASTKSRLTGSQNRSALLKKRVE